MEGVSADPGAVHVGVDSFSVHSAGHRAHDWKPTGQSTLAGPHQLRLPRDQVDAGPTHGEAEKQPEWALIEPLLPLELGFGSGQNYWWRLERWQQAGVFDQLHRTLLVELNAAGQLDWSRAWSAPTSARERGEPTPVRRLATGGRRAASTTSSATGAVPRSRSSPPRQTSMTSPRPLPSSTAYRPWPDGPVARAAPTHLSVTRATTPTPTGVSCASGGSCQSAPARADPTSKAWTKSATWYSRPSRSSTSSSAASSAGNAAPDPPLPSRSRHARAPTRPPRPRLTKETAAPASTVRVMTDFPCNGTPDDLSAPPVAPSPGLDLRLKTQAQRCWQKALIDCEVRRSSGAQHLVISCMK